MSEIWKLFDDLGEIVYVSDMDTNELIYLNKKGLRTYGFRTPQDFAGKTCHEVLQKCSRPCTMCNNPELVPGHFIKWDFYNPVLREYMLLFDTMLLQDGRRCRLEIAVDITKQEQRNQENAKQNIQNNLEMMVNSAVGIAVQRPTPDATIDCLLEHIGQMLDGERAYIFEKAEDESISNTYEWVSTGGIPEKDNLQNLPPEAWETWRQRFQESQFVSISHIENIRETDPIQYGILREQNVNSLVVIPLYDGEKINGFFGVDNPPVEILEHASALLNIMGHFISAAIKRRNLVRQLQDMSYRDQQTGFGNRFALSHFAEHVDQSRSLGVLFCDITGLKKINDTLGHKEGDMLIARCAACMRRVFDKAMLFRFGGDELVALCPGVEESELPQMVERFKAVLSEDDANMAIGCAYAQAGSVNMDSLMSEAETLMYKDKSLYYQTHGIDRRRQ